MSTLHVAKPAMGEKQSLSFTTDQTVTIGFDTGSATVERAGNDLVFQFDDGTEARITDFFVTDGKPLPNFVLEDGIEVSSADILKQLNDSMDLQTAAGPGAGGGASGSGAGEYADDPGALIGGIGRLGALDGLGQWGGGGFGDLTADTTTIGISLADDTGNLLPLTNATVSLFPLNEDMIAPGNAWANGGTLLVGQASAVDPEGGGITYSLSVSGQQAIVTTDTGSLSLGTYRIDPATGELFIDRVDHTGNLTGQAAAEALINSLRAGESYSLSAVTINLTDGVNVTTITAYPTVIGVNDVPILAQQGLADAFSESGYEGAGLASTLTGTLHAADADYMDIPTYWADMNGVTCVTTNSANTNITSGADYSKYGDFTLNQATGVWEFVSGAAHAAAIDQLANGETVTITLPVWAVDGSNATSQTEYIVITITGTNDAPVMTTPRQITVSEDDCSSTSSPVSATAYMLSGWLTATDVDAGDTLTFHQDGAATCVSDNPANTNLDISYYGLLTMTSSGFWSFRAPSTYASAYNSLREGETVTITIPVYAQDNSGAANDKSVTQHIVITIIGTNDAPVMTTSTRNLTFTFSEAQYEATSAYALNGTLTARDVDAGDTLTFYQATGATCTSDNTANTNLNISDYGMFTLLSDGTWTFIADTTKASAYNSLREGETVTITIPVYAQDDSSAANDKSATQNIVITITGTNDAPVMTTPGQITISEDSIGSGKIGGYMVLSWLKATDVDAGDTLTFHQDGAATCTSDNPANTNLNISDYGTFVMDSDGTWSFGTGSSSAVGTGSSSLSEYRAIASAYNSLREGETVTITIPVYAQDNSGAANDKSATQYIVITITGTNDAPVMTTSTSNLIFTFSEADYETASAYTLTGTLTARDVDAGDTLTFHSSISTATCTSDNTANTNLNISDYGTFTLLSDGTWAFVADTTMASAYNSLREGEIVTITIPVYAQDDSDATNAESAMQNIVITIIGTNDAPVMSASSHLTAAEDPQTSTGTLVWTDIDNDTSTSQFFLDAWSSLDQGTSDPSGIIADIDAVQGDYGTLKLNTATGSYEYILDTSVFSSTVHRVIDEFGVKVRDEGNGTSGTEEWSADSTLVVYGVDGTYTTGTSDDDSIGGVGSVLDDGKSHLIYGGAGNDTIDLNGTSGENILIWNAGDQGSGTPAVDTIKYFNAAGSNDGDMLDLRGLLSDVLGSDTSKMVNELLSFTVSGTDTTINVSDADGNVVQSIVLEGVALDDTQGSGYNELALQIMLMTQ